MLNSVLLYKIIHYTAFDGFHRRVVNRERKATEIYVKGIAESDNFYELYGAKIMGVRERKRIILDEEHIRRRVEVSNRGRCDRSSRIWESMREASEIWEVGGEDNYVLT